MLRALVGAPWYVSNQTLHTDLKIPFVTDAIKRIATKYNQRVVDYQNQLIEQLYNKRPEDVYKRQVKIDANA